MLNIFIVASVTLMYQHRLLSPPPPQIANQTHSRDRKLKPTALERRTGSQKEKLWFFFFCYHLIHERENPLNPSQGRSLWAFTSVTTLKANTEGLAWALKKNLLLGKLGIDRTSHNHSDGWSEPAPLCAAISVSINLGVKRQTSEDQTRLILLQISPQEMGSAEDLMFFKAVVIRLTAPFEELTVTVTPGVRGLALSFGVAAARKRKSVLCKWPLIYSTVCFRFHFNKSNRSLVDGNIWEQAARWDHGVSGSSSMRTPAETRRLQLLVRKMSIQSQVPAVSLILRGKQFGC